MKFANKFALALVLFAVALGLALADSDTSKLWVNIQSRSGDDRVIFIQDKETGTRCYAITNNSVNMSGYAISCVPKAAQ